MSFASSNAYARNSNPWAQQPSQYGYDEKDDMDSLKNRLAAKKKPIIAGVGVLCLAIVGITIAASTSGSNNANTKSGEIDQQQNSTLAPTVAPVASSAGSVAGEEQGPAKVVVAKQSWSSSGSGSTAGSGSHHNDAGVGQVTPAVSANTTQAVQTTAPPTTPPSTTAAPAPTTKAAAAPTTSTPSGSGEQLPYKDANFDWKNAANWEYASHAAVPSSVFTEGGMKLTPANSYTAIRTKQGWSGEKVVLIEWERSGSSDTNIWMLNTKLEEQYAVGNGWPYWGELDIFEMFTQDAANPGNQNYDYSGNGGRKVNEYGQMTMHMGPRKGEGDPCFCPSAPSKSQWYQNSQPMTSGCTAQFENKPSNSIATVWGSDGNGKYIQLLQNPTITKGGKTGDGKQTYNIAPGGTTSPKIYNNANTFWGVPSSAGCARAGGHNANTGFPFFEAFRIVLEEQKKNDASAWFKVNNVQILIDESDPWR